MKKLKIVNIVFWIITLISTILRIIIALKKGSDFYGDEVIILFVISTISLLISVGLTIIISINSKKNKI